jgi:hypothetical protein
MTPYCPQHTKLILGLEVKDSTIPNAGKGLFAVRGFRKNDKITEYTGIVLTKSQIDQLYGKLDQDLSPYAVQISEDLFMDSSCARSIAAFANDSKSHNNAKLSTNRLTNRVFLRAIKNINPQDEIFTSYGENYFQNNDLPKPVFSTSSRKLNKSQPETVIPQPIYSATRASSQVTSEKKSQHSWDSSYLEVKESSIPGAGQGLFAKKTIHKNDIIVCIDHPLELEEGEEDAEDAGFPHDSVIYFKPTPRSRQISVFDQNWTNPNHVPLWYRMNHGQKEANAELIPTMTQYGPSVCWKAKRKIEKNEEILFNYTKGSTVRF